LVDLQCVRYFRHVFGKAEINYNRIPAPINHDIFRLEISKDVLSAMHIGQRIRNANGVELDLRFRQALHLRVGMHDTEQFSTLDERLEHIYHVFVYFREERQGQRERRVR
jgi:hypothetical protein